MLITFEGIDGSGKSTQISRLKERLEEAGEEVFVYREPGGTDVSERIRTLLLDPMCDIEPFSEFLLFSAARSQLVSEKIRPALQRGCIVLCDRFYDSTTAYQGAGRRLGDIAWMIDFHARVTGNLVPDRTYYLSIPVAQALKRRQEREGQVEDRMEKTGKSFFERVVQAYEGLVEQYPERFVKLDGTLPILSLHDLIWDDIQYLTKENRGTTLLG